jgi:hypothetical protein
VEGEQHGGRRGGQQVANQAVPPVMTGLHGVPFGLLHGETRLDRRFLLRADPRETSPIKKQSNAKLHAN